MAPSSKQWQVMVGFNTVHSGNDETIARDVFDTYVRMSQKRSTFTGDNDIFLLHGRDIVESYVPPFEDEV